jgi:hypothetical protein
MHAVTKLADVLIEVAKNIPRHQEPRWINLTTSQCHHPIYPLPLNSFVMASYRDLVRPIPAKHNLSNVVDITALDTCTDCRAVVPDRRKAKNNTIKTGYMRVDEYPGFPGLKSSAKSGCALCEIIRKTLRQSWAVRPMEEWGNRPLSENDSFWDYLMDYPWDRKVRISRLSFRFSPLVNSKPEKGLPSSQLGGMITGMSLEFGPATQGIDENGNVLHEHISQVLGFKCYDSIGKSDDSGSSSSNNSRPNM